MIAYILLAESAALAFRERIDAFVIKRHDTIAFGVLLGPEWTQIVPVTVVQDGLAIHAIT